MRETLLEAVFRASIGFVWAVAVLAAWNVWPTDGDPGGTVDAYHFHIRS